MARLRANIEIEDDYVQAIMDRYRLRTKTEAVDLALRHLAGQPTTREEALAMRGAHASARFLLISRRAACDSPRHVGMGGVRPGD